MPERGGKSAGRQRRGHLSREALLPGDLLAEPADAALLRQGAVWNGTDVLARYDDNGSRQITCREAKRRGIAPVAQEHPAYRYMRDGDGAVCE